MKLATLACMLTVAVSAFAQTNPQSSCPVVFTNVALKSHATYLPVQTGASSSGNLGFDYKNLSGKEIQSIAMNVELTTKKSLYALDATPVTIKMLLTGNSIEAALPQVGYVYGIGSVTLEGVAYTDGTTWNAGKQVCQYNNPGGPEQIVKLW
ncbi:MAG TPA: hypothetical protein VHT24_00445 [Pseudacidobacterium sp.]|jgi:hypothetical protein|nr:hypothetical protein [Pseudacidobacterium sp.]